MVEAYKGYTIVVAGILDDFSRKYAPMASISWQENGGTRKLHIIDNSPRRFLDPNEAAQFALSEAQKWVDEQVI
jgi:hypothetical protein